MYYFTKGAHNFHLKKLKNFINKKCSLGLICITKFQYFQILREKKIGVCTSKKAKNAQKLTLHLKFLKIFVLKLYLILSVTFWWKKKIRKKFREKISGKKIREKIISGKLFLNISKHLDTKGMCWKFQLYKPKHTNL